MRLFSHQPLAHRNRLLLALVLSVTLAACGGESSEALIEKAQQSLASGDRKSAIIQLKSAIQKNENNAEARFWLGKLQLEMGDFASAEKEFIKAREAGYDADTVNPLLAKALIGQGKFRRVLDDLPQPAQGGKDAVPMLIMRASAQLGTGKKEEARKSLSQAAAAAPEDAEVMLAQARLALADGDPTKAGQHIDDALRIDPKNRDGWLFKGDLLRAMRKPAESAEAYRAALKLHPGHEGAHTALANIAIDEGRFEDARREVGVILKVAPNNLLARYTVALIDFREKKYESARDHLGFVLKNVPNYMPAVLLAGAVEYAMGNMQTAESHLNRVVAAAPRNLYALRLLAATQLGLRRPDDATRTLGAIPEVIYDTGLHVIAGEIAQAQKQYAKAAAHFEKAAQMSPESAGIRTDLALARMAQGDQRAMADLQAAASLDEGGGRADKLVILTQLRMNQADAALAPTAALEKKQGVNPLTLNYRGAAYLAKNDAARARASFTEALKLEPAFFPAAANLAQLDLRDKQPAAARKRFEGVLKADPNNLNAMLALADLSRANNDEKAYVNWLERASKAAPRALPPRAAMVSYLLGKGSKDRALAIAREALNANPDNPAALNLLGTAQMAAGDKTGAISTFTALTAKAPQNPQAYLNLAKAQIMDKRVPDARATLNKALKRKPDHLEVQAALIGLEMADGKPDAALTVARSIQRQQPKSPAGFASEGDIRLMQKQASPAIRAYQQALERGAGPATVVSLHRAYLLAGDSRAGDARLSDWIRKNPTDRLVRSYAAEYHMVNQRNKEAITQYEEILRQVPKDVVSLNNLANLYRVENDKRALATAEQAYKLAPASPAIQDTLGWILVEQGQAARGRDLLEKAVSAAPAQPTIRYHHAAALARTGDKARAKKALESLLLDTPEFPEAGAAKDLLRRL
jgi:putative PEP-CTERM system TPR-repeat lipoprotein